MTAGTITKVLLTAVVAAALLLPPGVVRAEDGELEELKARIEVLEAETEETDRRFSDLMEISGYADSEYIITDKGTDADGFRVHHLSFHFIKQIDDKWKMFSEVEFEYGPKIGEDDGAGNIKYKEGKLFVEVFTIDYAHNPKLNMRLGRYLTPGGIWNVEHYPPFVPTQQRPQHIRKLFPQVMDGLQFNGTTDLGGTVTDYILYVGNGSGNDGSGDGNANKAYGGRLKFKVTGATELGLSLMNERDNSGVAEDAFGVDLKYRWKKLGLQAEYASGEFTPLTGTGYERTGYYGQLIYGIGKLDLIYRYDWYDADDTVVDGDTVVNTFALNYHFTPSVVGKLETHFHEYEDETEENYNKTLISLAVYLGSL